MHELRFSMFHGTSIREGGKGGGGDTWYASGQQSRVNAISRELLLDAWSGVLRGNSVSSARHEL